MLVISDPALTTIRADALRFPNYNAELWDEAGTKQAWVTDADRFVFSSGQVAGTWKSRKSSGGTDLVQATTARQATLTTDATVKGKPFLRFRYPGSGSSMIYPFTSFPAGAALDWTKIMLVRMNSIALDAGAITGANIWQSTNVVGRHFLNIAPTTGLLNHRVGIAPDNSDVSIAGINWANWHLVMAAWDHTLGQSALSVDGGPWVLGTAVGTAQALGTNAAIGAASDVTLGANVDLLWAEVDQKALHLPANAEKCAVVRQLARDKWGLSYIA